jgi:Tfp pilus assembly protein PilO
MNKLSKEKRDRLLLVCIGTAILLALTYFFLIRPQYDALAKIKTKTAATRRDLQDKDDAIKRQDAVQSELHAEADALAKAENDVAVGDPNAWIYEAIRRFKGHYKVDISSFSQSVVGSVDLLPGFPYKQLKVTIAGTAYYHDLGKFIADFENSFPHTRIQNVALEPKSADSSTDANTDTAASPTNSEKLSFRMDVVALVRSGEAQN